MVKISNKPNVNGINNVSEDVDYSAKLIAREGKLFAGLICKTLRIIEVFLNE